jgi:hypothetical protein
MEFVAQFLGRRLTDTYRVRTWAPGERFMMNTVDGPFPMETTYTWRALPTRGTKMNLRTRGEPSGFSRIAAPVMARAMTAANTKDLARLQALLEG